MRSMLLIDSWRFPHFSEQAETALKQLFHQTSKLETFKEEMQEKFSNIHTPPRCLNLKRHLASVRNSSSPASRVLQTKQRQSQFENQRWLPLEKPRCLEET